MRLSGINMALAPLLWESFIGKPFVTLTPVNIIPHFSGHGGSIDTNYTILA